MKIVITDDRFGHSDEEKSVFSDDDLIIANCCTEEDLIQICADADGILLNQAPMTDRVIQTLQKCKVISRYGIGYDNVDVRAATEAGIWVTNVPGYCTEEVAEHVLGLLLSCVRAIPDKDRGVRSGQWNINRPIRRMSGRVLGIVGFGSTGKAFWKKVRGFAFDRILITDPRGEEKLLQEKTAGKFSDLCNISHAVIFDELLEKSDYISFHVPLKENTRHLVNRESIAKMKDGAIIINITPSFILAIFSRLTRCRVFSFSGTWKEI